MNERRRENGVTLQISVAPADLPHARETLAHQLRQWGGQVDEVVFTLDLGPTSDRRSGDWPGLRSGVEELLADLCSRSDHARVVPVDYTEPARREVSRRLFAGSAVPLRDCYGKAVYPYFFGLLAGRHRYVLHLDSDMMFGGGAQTWVEEAKRLLLERGDIFSCSPLPGPPSDRPFPRHVARGHAGSTRRRALRANGVPFTSSGLSGPAFRFTRLSTRDFMLDRSVFEQAAVAVEAARAKLRDRLAGAARRMGNRAPGHDRSQYAPAEASLSEAMRDLGRIRVDFLGSPPGMWSVHPPLRSATFYRELPDLIARIERGEVPDGQRGDYDLNDSMVDWSSARAARRWTPWRS